MSTQPISKLIPSTQTEINNSLKIAAYATDSFEDEIKAAATCRIYIFDKESKTNSWDDSLITAFCTLQYELSKKAINIFAINLITKQTCFTAKQITNISFQSTNWISFNIKHYNYLVGLQFYNDEEANRFQTVLKELMEEQKKVEIKITPPINTTNATNTTTSIPVNNQNKLSALPITLPLDNINNNINKKITRTTSQDSFPATTTRTATTVDALNNYDEIPKGSKKKSLLKRFSQLIQAPLYAHSPNSSVAIGGSSGTSDIDKKRSSVKISAPKISAFKHMSHIGFDMKEKRFTNVPQEWKEIFEKAGISQSDLKDKHTAKFIAKSIQVIGDHGENVSQLRKKPLPPIPAKLQRGKATTATVEEKVTKAPNEQEPLKAIPISQITKPSATTMEQKKLPISSTLIPTATTTFPEMKIIPPAPNDLLKFDEEPPVKEEEKKVETVKATEETKEGEETLSFAEQIKRAKLRPVEHATVNPAEMTEEEKNDLAFILKEALNQRRFWIEEEESNVSSEQDELQ
ncbi:hypothetical protein ABK040_010665 [Willaertia magna]